MTAGSEGVGQDFRDQNQRRRDETPISDSVVDAALKASVPGGSQVWCWLPQKDGWTPHKTARVVIRCALEEAAPLLFARLAAPAEVGARGGESALREALLRRADECRSHAEGLLRPQACAEYRAKEAAFREAAALASPAAPGGVLPDGWVAVPVELAGDMYKAAWKIIPPTVGVTVQQVWAALLAARPPLSGRE